MGGLAPPQIENEGRELLDRRPPVEHGDLRTGIGEFLRKEIEKLGSEARLLRHLPLGGLTRQAAQRHLGDRLGAAILFAERIRSEHIARVAERNDLPSSVLEKLVKPDEAALDAVDVALTVALVKEMLMGLKLAQRLLGENVLHGAPCRSTAVDG